MIREIMHDEAFFAQKSTPASEADLQIVTDLQDTLEANKSKCVGMAANMIGELKNIIVFYDSGSMVTMLNAKIIEGSGKYVAEEGCLSLEGTRKANRFEHIKVRFKDVNFKTQIRSYSGFAAEIVQHELDHVAGKII